MVVTMDTDGPLTYCVATRSKVVGRAAVVRSMSFKQVRSTIMRRNKIIDQLLRRYTEFSCIFLHCSIY